MGARQTRRGFLGALAAGAVASAQSSQEQRQGEARCTRPEPAGVAGDTFIVCVDRTAERTEVFNENVLVAVAQMMRPDLRAVIWTFGGRRAIPQLVGSTVFRQPSRIRGGLGGFVQRALAPSDAEEKLRVCERDAFDTQKDAMLNLLKKELALYDGADSGQSPIVLALNSAVQPYVQAGLGHRVQVLVCTDGLEHGPAVSFYGQPGGRMPTKAEAVERTRVHFNASWAGVTFHLAGLGSAEGADAASAHQLMEIWRAIIQARQGVVGELSPSAPQRLFASSLEKAA